MAEKSNDTRQRISLDLTRELVAHLDHLRREWGIRSRGDVLERLLDDLFGSGDEDDDGDDDGDGESSAACHVGGGHGLVPEGRSARRHGEDERDLEEQGALVLVGRGAMDTLQA